MFTALKHTFQSFEEHLHKLFNHVEEKAKETEAKMSSVAKEEAEKVADDVREDFLALRSEIRSELLTIKSDLLALRQEVGMKLAAPAAAPVVHIPVPANDHNPEVAALASLGSNTPGAGGPMQG